MRDVIRRFEEKVEEVNTYFRFLEDMMVREGKIIFKDQSQQQISINLAQILRANGFLLLYNLVESSITQAIEAIHHEIIDKQVNYDTLNRLVKKEIFNYVKRNVKSDDFIDKINSLTTGILQFHPQSREIFSGNVDAKEIRKLAKRYGFSHLTNKEITRDGNRLLTVKDKRNDLAHGFISFQECGKDYTVEDIIEIKNEAISYVEKILLNIENYLTEEKYKHPQ